MEEARETENSNRFGGTLGVQVPAVLNPSLDVFHLFFAQIPFVAKRSAFVVHEGRSK